MHRRPVAVLFLLLGITVTSARADGASSPLQFGNRTITLRLVRTADAVRLVAIENHLAHRETTVQDAGFALLLDDGTRIGSEDCTAAQVETADLPKLGHRAAGRRMTVTMQTANRLITIQAVYEVRAGESWIEQYFRITGPVKTRVRRIVHATLSMAATIGPTDRGRLEDGSLGFPDGCGQPIYGNDLFVGIMHPAAENLRTEQGLACAMDIDCQLHPADAVESHRLVIGVSAPGARRRAFVSFLYQRRQRPARMVVLINDWYWKDKTHPLADLRKLAAVKQRTHVPIDSFTFDDGWSTYTDKTAGLWGALDETRFSCTWRDLTAAAQQAEMNVSLWFGPIGGYSYRPRRLPMAKQLGFEVNGDKLCLAGSKYGAYVRTAFQRWARAGMDYIKVDGFWPNCAQPEHGHPIGAGGAVAQMDALIDTFHSWRQARPDLLIGYTSGSNPSPFWLFHADYLWRGGADDAHQGVGSPADRYLTFVDRCLQRRRHTDVPISAFVTFDLISRRILPADDATLDRTFWWCAARGSLNHDWYLHPSDLTDDQWTRLGAVTRWAKKHTATFQFAQMIGGDVTANQVYGFAAFDGRRGTLALRNPSDRPLKITGTLQQWLALTPGESHAVYEMTPVFGAAQGLGQTAAGDAMLTVSLKPLGIVVAEIEPTRKLN